jgi:dihydroflavonol-4-reductase
MSRVLVTGATGFLGRHTVPALVAAGHEVVALVRGDGAEVEALGARVAKGDVLDKASVRAAAEGCTYLVHAAGKVSRDVRDAELLYRVHVEGTKNTLDASADAGIRRAVVLSTSGVVAVSEAPDFIARETDETPLTLIQRWPYYRSKLYAEKAALDRNRDGFEVLCLNPTLLLGPGDLMASSTEDVRLFLERRVPAVPPGGLSFVDVRDVAKVVVSALTLGRPGERYLLGAQNLTLREFFGRLSRLSDIPAPLVPLPRAPEVSRMGMQILTDALSRFGVKSPVDPVSLDMAQFYWYLDASKAEDELGFAPRDATETLADTIKDLRERGVVWPA